MATTSNSPLLRAHRTPLFCIQQSITLKPCRNLSSYPSLRISYGSKPPKSSISYFLPSKHQSRISKTQIGDSNPDENDHKRAVKFEKDDEISVDFGRSEFGYEPLVLSSHREISIKQAGFMLPKSVLKKKVLTFMESKCGKLSDSEGVQIRKDVFEQIAIQIKKVLDYVKKPTTAAVLLGLLLSYDPNRALAASGGRIGGSNFSKRSSSSSSSTSSMGSSRSSSYSTSYLSSPSSMTSSISSSSKRSSSSMGSSRSSSYTTSSPSSPSSMTSSISSPSSPSSMRYSAPYHGPSHLWDALCAGLILVFAFCLFSSFFGSGFSMSSFFLFFVSYAAFLLVAGLTYLYQNLTDAQKTSVIKLQVGLLGSGRTLQQNLNSLAETADTSTSEGLSYVLTEAILALLRRQEYCLSCCSSLDVKQSIEDGEDRFTQLSIEERGKFDEETLVNVNSIKRRNSKIGTVASGHKDGYVVVTILVAVEGRYKLQPINTSADLKEALQKLGTIQKNKIMAVEVMWTPQDEKETLSERKLLEDYPLLRPL